jgi:hypothetical protein
MLLETNEIHRVSIDAELTRRFVANAVSLIYDNAVPLQARFQRGVVNDWTSKNRTSISYKTPAAGTVSASLE